MRADVSQRERWHHLLHACDAYRYFFGPGIVNNVTKVGHAQNIYYKRIVL